MPQYKVQLSDGRVVDLESDSEPSEEDVLGSLPQPKASQSDALNYALSNSLSAPQALNRVINNPAAIIGSRMGRRQSLEDQMAAARTQGTQDELASSALSGLGKGAEFVSQMEPLNLLKRTMEIPGQLSGDSTPLAPAISPELAGNVIDYFDPTPDEAGSTKEGLKKFAAETLSTLSRPDQAAALVAGKAAPELVARLFQTQMAGSIPSAAQQLQEAIQSGDKSEIARAGAGLVATAGMPALIEKGIRSSKSLNYAKAIRSDTGPSTEQGVLPGGRQETRSNDLQQPPSQESQPVGTGEEAQVQVAPIPNQQYEGFVPQELRDKITPIAKELLEKLRKAQEKEQVANDLGNKDLIAQAEKERRSVEDEMFNRLGDTSPLVFNTSVANRIASGTHVWEDGYGLRRVKTDAEVKAPPAAVTGEETPAAPTVNEAKASEVAPSEAGPAMPSATTPADVSQVGSVTHDVTQGLTGPQMGAAGAEEIPFTGAGGEKYGIAARIREERSQAGQVDPVATGMGIAPIESIEEGRKLERANPGLAEKLQSEFEADPLKRYSTTLFQITRAHGEALAAGARTIEEQFGTDTPQYREARKVLDDWEKRTKGPQTEWSNSGKAQQGETDIDTGSFTGLDRLHEETHGEPIPAAKIPRAKKMAKSVKEAADSEAGTHTEVKQELEKLGETPENVRDAEKAAIDAANKTVRENAVRLADAETAARVAKTVRDKQAADVQRKAAAAALKASQEVAKEHAARLAKAESEVKSTAVLNEQAKAAQAAVSAADKVVMDNAKRLSDAQVSERAAKSPRDKAAAKVQIKAARKAVAAADELHRKAAIELARTQARLQADPIKRVWTKVGEYLDKGLEDIHDIRNKVATDLGMKVDRVARIMNQKERLKYLSDELYKKQLATERLRQDAKAFVSGMDTDPLLKAAQAVPKVTFGMKIFGHGPVGIGTHAPMTVFMPRYWNAVARNYRKMWKMMTKTAYYKEQMSNLARDPNWRVANEGGLQNDPHTFEDYTSPDMVKWITGGKMGTRGFAALKILRQDMFNQRWNKLPRSLQIPEMAAAISKGVNHDTGIVETRMHPVVGLGLFAPRLEASRVAWLAVDPAKAAYTFSHWWRATPAEREFAMYQLKSKAWVAGTYYALLMANQGILDAQGSKQKINLTDPFKSDFLKFKIAGMNLSFGNAMLNMAKLPIEMYKIVSSDGGKTKSLIYADESAYTVLGKFARSQMSPFAGIATDLGLGADYASRPLPRAGFGLVPQNRPMPKRLAAQGLKPYSWTEYGLGAIAPIPAQEALKEVWKEGLGMSPEQVKNLEKAMAISAVMGTTGARLTDDWELKKQSTPKGF